MLLSHYYDQETGPFRNLSDLSPAEAARILDDIKTRRPTTQCAKRQPTYLQDRQHYEAILRSEFIQKGGKPERNAPHYMIVGHSPWLLTWYEHPACITLPVEAFDTSTLSFTYGDSHPTFSPRVNDGREYRKKLYTYEEIVGIIEKYGLPQDWNPDGAYGPERYVEVQVWSDETIGKYLEARPPCADIS